MPEENVSDLQDVFDAINRLCETMRTSTFEEAETETIEEPTVDEIEQVVEAIETVQVMKIIECEEELAGPNEVAVRVVDAYRAERWSDALVSPPEDEDTEQGFATAEPLSEMYYTASSEVSLLSDGEVPKTSVENDTTPHEQEKEDKESQKECVITGHVAAMRERFESMTRENTPCPDLTRSMSPTFDVFRNITPSPDRLG